MHLTRNRQGLKYITGNIHGYSSLISLRSKRFQREIGRARKREVGGRGGERKETLADRPRDFENRPLQIHA